VSSTTSSSERARERRLANDAELTTCQTRLVVGWARGGLAIKADSQPPLDRLGFRGSVLRLRWPRVKQQWICTMSQKNDTKLLPITSRNINRFSNFFFTDGLVSKFATHPCLNIPPRIEHVATLPREI